MSVSSGEGVCSPRFLVRLVYGLRYAKVWMSMIATRQNDALLEAFLTAYGIESSPMQRGLLLSQLDFVIEKNRSLNLTRITDPKDAIIRHVVDSLLILPSLRKAQHEMDTRFLDIGTGAGFPGIPIGIMTGMEGLLIDSIGKKVHAVHEFIKRLGLNDRLEAQSIRAEELALRAPSSFGIVMARAVAELGVLVEYAAPLLTMGGMLVASKAHVSDEEFSRGEATARIVGLELVSRETYELPEDSGYREVLTFLRKRESRVPLPRQTGMAKHKPLVE